MACLKKNQFLPTERTISLPIYYFSELIQKLHNTEEMASWIAFVPLIQEHSYCIAQNPKTLWTTFTISVRTFPLQWNWQIIFLISNFRRVLYVLCFLLGNSLASEFYMATFRKTMFHLLNRPAYEDGTECSETSAYKIQRPGNHPKGSIQHGK
jgi:hypothetical protein